VGGNARVQQPEYRPRPEDLRVLRFDLESPRGGCPAHAVPPPAGCVGTCACPRHPVRPRGRRSLAGGTWAGNGARRPAVPSFLNADMQ